MTRSASRPRYKARPMAGQVYVIGHPLVQHKLTLMRSKDTSTSSFRTLLREISVLPAADVLPGGVRSTRIHLVMDHDRPAVLALLAELARSPRILAVEGMKLRPQAPSSRTEIEVRVLIRVLGEGEER